MRDTACEMRRIKVEVVEHRSTHLLVAYSKDMPGLTVAARSLDQLIREIPGAIKEMLEAEGKTGVVVETHEDDEDLPASFFRRSVVAKASFAHA